MLSSQYTDWHLTPRGWETGTQKTDYGTTRKRSPRDRVLTARYTEEQPNAYSHVRRSQVIWESEDDEIVAALLHKFGQPPEKI